MKNIWFVLCGRAVIDQMTNALTLQECIDELTVTFNEPADMQKEIKEVPMNFMAVNLWHDENIATERTLDYQVEILDPQGIQSGSFTVSAKFEVGKKRLRTIAQIGGLKLTTEGKYLFKTKYKNEAGAFVEAAEVPIDVKFVLNIKK